MRHEPPDSSGHLGARILVVDDDRQLRRLLILALADEGYEVRACSDGRTALGLLRDWQPQVIVLDLMMPEVDGWTFRTLQLASPDIAAIPVVVLSAGHGLRTEELRAAAILPKPFDLDCLLSTVTRIVRYGASSG